MKIKSLLFISSLSALLCVAIVSSAVAVPVEKWSKTFGDIEFDCGNSVQQTQDGGYILSGETIVNYDEADASAFLMKLTPDGTEEWNKTFGGPGYDSAYSVQQTEDKGYVLAGYLEGDGQPGERDSDAWLIKTDSNGSEKWNKTFGGENNDYAYSVLELDDGGYIMDGYTESFGAGGADAWLIKTDANGTEVWNRTFGGPYTDNLCSVQKARDGGFILAGSTQQTSDYNDTQALLIKTNSKGVQEWNMTFGGNDIDFINFAQETREGEYILVGGTYSYGKVSEVWVIKVGFNKGMDAKLENPAPELENVKGL